MRTMPSAAASGASPSGAAIRSAIARRAPSASSRMSPPRNRSAARRPSTRFASVTVGSVAAERVADRTRLRARALRPDAHRAAGAQPRDAAAAGADFLDVDHRDLDRQAFGVAADHRRVRHQRLAVHHDAGLRGGAAHVERDRALEPERCAEALRADHARGRARLEHADAFAPRLRAVEEAAGRLHDQEPAGERLAPRGRRRPRSGSVSTRGPT